MYDWSDIHVFLTVMEQGSASAAARQLGTNQTTVSRRIDRIEAALSLRLFEKGPRGAVPTENAQALLPHAQRMRDAAEALDARGRSLTRQLSGAIRLTTTPGVPRHISGLLRAFSERHPEVRFELDADERAVSLEDGEADVALRSAMQLTGDTLIGRRILDHPWGVYGSAAYLDRHGSPSSVEEMAGHRLVLYPQHVAQRIETIQAVQDRLGADPSHLRVSSVEAVSGLLLDGAGLGLLPRASGDIEPGLRFCFREPGMWQRFWLVWPPQSETTPHIRAFIRFVTDGLPDFLRGMPPEWRV
ncbi:MAG: LysR family transcriptional regulator [Pseudomonadota bacterium]